MAGVVLVVAGVLAVTALSAGVRLLARPRSHAVTLTALATPASSLAATATPTTVEVPDLTGQNLKAASTVLGAAGLVVDVRTQTASSSAPPGTVLWQDPSAGELVPTGTRVILRVVPARSATAAPTVAVSSAPAHGAPYVVCIDPGHQAVADSVLEPVGPGSSTLKAAVSGGATGVSTHVPEYELALQISMNLKARLEAMGVKVVMTRTTNDVHLSNEQRAAIANSAHSNLFIRVHCDSSTSPSVVGVSTLYPGRDKWTGPIVARSKVAASDVQGALLKSTSAQDRGLSPRTDLAGFNFSKVPVILVECGFMSNPVEDRLMASPAYQDKLASGMTAGILSFLRSNR